MTAYYNEFDPYAAQWLRNLMAKGLIPTGEVDERSITDVQADDLRGFTQCHFFAGIGGWSLALRIAGWPDDRPVWTGSCPCQPYSVAGKQEGQGDERDLWPVWNPLIAAIGPPVVFGEQVAAAVGKHWLDRVRVDLEAEGYTIGAAVLPACAVGAPHRRDRLWIVAHAAGGGIGTDGRAQEAERNGGNGHADFRSQINHVADAEPTGRQGGLHGPGSLSEANGWGPPVELERRGEDGSLGHPAGEGPFPPAQTGVCSGEESGRSRHVEFERHGFTLADTNGSRGEAGLSAPAGGQEGQPEVPNHGSNRCPGPWGECDWLIGADGKARRVEPTVRLLAHGVPARVGKLRAFGNAIVPQVAAEFIGAYMDLAP